MGAEAGTVCLYYGDIVQGRCRVDMAPRKMIPGGSMALRNFPKRKGSVETVLAFGGSPSPSLVMETVMSYMRVVGRPLMYRIGERAAT